ncbi:MAG: hypothetical protein JNK14_20645 [Chitinophagaceae bacterium]|nr:hypothetical protein [Chitinophagaceae bacterium]
MKPLLVLWILAAIMITAGCNKHSCSQSVTITQQGTPCGQWAIQKNGNVYPADSIPTIFQEEGLVVCAKYELYEDMGMCACCGGTWARILSMTHLPE